MLNGFVGEFLILSSTFTGVSRGWAIAATISVILGAAYMLSLVQSLFYGPESTMTATRPVVDINLGEFAVLAPLAVLMLVMGLAPSIWMPAIEKSVNQVHIKQVATSSRLVPVTPSHVEAGQ
jgi:NADH-quinone oxidoreductase subunit M